MRNAATRGWRWQYGLSITRCKSQIAQGIMRKKSSSESLDFVKLLDSKWSGICSVERSAKAAS
jgi:hypothetical protein